MKSPTVKYSLHSNNNIEIHNVNNVSLNHGCLQSYRMLALFHSQWENCVQMVYCFSFSAYIRFFCQGFVEMCVIISNELNFSDVYQSFATLGC